MKLELEIQKVSVCQDVPAEVDFSLWARAALEGRRERAELVIRLVDEDEIAALNRDYRGKDGPTNVLSFPFEAPPPVQSDLIGDLVICAPIVAREAAQQGKVLRGHWAHIVVHGVLHLLGYDHLSKAEAEIMEGVEIEILAGLGYSDPYACR
jgi:probable rRNA maturation factor